MSVFFEKLQWHFYRRFSMQKKVLGFNAHPFTFVCPKSTFSEFSHVMKNSTVINSEVGRFSRVSGGCLNYVSLGNFSAVAVRTFAGGGGEHPLDQVSFHSIFYKASRYQHPNMMFVNEDIYDDTPKKIIIENDVWVGSDCFIKPGVTIGNGAVIASGSAVVKDVPPYAIVGGVPAKVIKYRHSPELIELLISSEWWNWPIEKLKIITKNFDQDESLTVERFNEILLQASELD
jgi:acetyltransferase-like isoleucine patch superfamily enzyme